jgi:uncharacterized cupredoxin-like copper-binding protein
MIARNLALAFSAASLLAASATISAAQGPQTIEVRLTNFSFTPSTLNLKSGQAYDLRLVNDKKSNHSFSAPDLFANSTLAPGSQVADGKVEVGKNQTVDVQFTPNKPGHYGIKCTHPLHAGFGMKGEAIVE